MTECPRCGGEGVVTLCPPGCDGSHVDDRDGTCPECHGSGQVRA